MLFLTNGKLVFEDRRAMYLWYTEIAFHASVILRRGRWLHLNSTCQVMKLTRLDYLRLFGLMIYSSVLEDVQKPHSTSYNPINHLYLSFRQQTYQKRSVTCDITLRCHAKSNSCRQHQIPWYFGPCVRINTTMEGASTSKQSFEIVRAPTWKCLQISGKAIISVELFITCFLAKQQPSFLKYTAQRCTSRLPACYLQLQIFWQFYL